MTRFYMDISDADDEFDRLGRIDEETALGLARELFDMFMETQMRVHIDTHSLKTSGQANVENTPGRWEGEISYGGPAPGMPHDPVTYAEEEMNRSAECNYMQPASDSGRNFAEVIDDFLEGTLNE